MKGTGFVHRQPAAWAGPQAADLSQADGTYGSESGYSNNPVTEAAAASYDRITYEQGATYQSMQFN